MRCLSDDQAKVTSELHEWRNKFEEKSRQKRKLYELYSSLKLKAEGHGVPMSPAPFGNVVDSTVL